MRRPYGGIRKTLRPFRGEKENRNPTPRVPVVRPWRTRFTRGYNPTPRWGWTTHPARLTQFAALPDRVGAILPPVTQGGAALTLG